MREITVLNDEKTKTKVVIKSPWLSPADAARYLDISLSQFQHTVAGKCPCQLFGRMRKYHVHALDKFDPQNSTGDAADEGIKRDRQ